MIKQKAHTTLRAFALSLSALLAGGAALNAQEAPSAAGQAQAAPQQQLQREYQQISQQLQQAQQAAMESAEVQSAIELAQTTLKEKMLEFAPDKAGQIDRFFALQNQLRSQSGDAPQEEMQAKVRELRGLQSEIQPAQQKAMQSAEFQEAQKSAQDAMRSAMMEENPDARDLIRRQREIINEVRSQQPAPGAGAPKPGN